jgi:transposase
MSSMTMSRPGRKVSGDNVGVESDHPAAGGPRRRVFTAAEKLAHLEAYEAACEQPGGGGAYLRREGLYSSLISEWRKLRDGGALTDAAAEQEDSGASGKSAAKRGRLSAEQAEIARLRAELARANKRLTTTEAALDIMGKAHALLESLSERADSQNKPGKR